jgi:hypothetical protein
MYNSAHEYIDERNAKLIANLKHYYVTDNIALLLGAGVSCDYNKGISWSKLVLELFVRKFSAKYSYYSSEKFVCPPKTDDYQERESSLLDIAEYSSPSHLVETVSSKDIADMNSRFSANLVYHVLNTYKSDLTNSVNKNGQPTLLYELAKFAFDRQKGRVRIKNIITYNYDDFMEAALLVETKTWPAINVSVITEENTFSPFCYKKGRGDSITIYHVHGFIPTAIDEKLANNVRAIYLPKATQRIVLGEGSYSSLGYDDKLWTNSIQAQVNSQMPILCVGFSCTDPNFRRLFSSIRRNSGDSPIYALLPAHKCKKELAALLEVKVDKITDDMVICYMQIIEEYYAQQYQIYIVWSKDFDDMTTIIQSIAL